MRLILLLFIFITYSSFAQNYATALNTDKYLTCDELENLIVKKCKLKHGWDEYELKSNFLEKVKLYSRHHYNFALVKMKDNENYYVYCDIPIEHFLLFSTLVGPELSSGKLFNKYISPHKCDCK